MKDRYHQRGHKHKTINADKKYTLTMYKNTEYLKFKKKKVTGILHKL